MSPDHGRPEAVDGAVLQALVDVSADGLAVLDARGRFTLVNAAAAHILGAPAGELHGRETPFGTGPVRPGRDRLRTTWADPTGHRHELEYRLAPATGGGHVVWFSDVTDTLRQQERLTAVARAASSVAAVGSLRGTLDAVAREMVMTSGVAAVQILAIDDPRDDLRVLGMAGFGAAAEFTERLGACRRRGAHVRFMDAFLARVSVVVPHRKAAILADPAWAPLHAIMDRPDWDTFVSVPLVVRGRALGVINAYYTPGEEPGPSSLAFLEAMSDHAALAIDTAALMERTWSQAQLDERRRMARDLHDSVVQQLFSMRMQAGALLAQVDRAGPDPARVRGGAAELVDLARDALADLRGFVFELRPLDLAQRGLVEAVRVHAASLASRTGLAITVDAPADLDLDSAIDVQEDLYRIVQEALHNVVKHARAATVGVRFAPATRERGLIVEVTDDGPGPVVVDAAGAAQRDTLGLVSMRERAQRWGGRFTAGPHPAGGWTVRVTLPVPRAEDDAS